MDIITNKIHLAITDEEANVILSALSRFQGVYGDTQELTHPEDVARQEMSLNLADKMRVNLELELLERWHNRKASDYSRIQHPGA